jgi:hypothetical protein
LRWDEEDWLYFGGALVAIGVAHSFDERCRRRASGYTGGMISLRSRLASSVVVAVLTGCGHSDGSEPKIAERADVNITLDNQRHTCVVALDQEPQGSSVRCDEAVPFLKDELRLKAGAVYDIRVTPGFDEAQMTHLGTSLNEAGYRFIGGRSNPLFAQPGKGR